MFTAISTFFSQFKIYLYVGILAAATTFWLYDRHEQYNKGYTAAATAQNAAIEAYQKIVVQKDQQAAADLARLADSHAKEITTLQNSIPQAQEKIRVVTKTVDRPTACNLVHGELDLINQAIGAANKGVSSSLNSGSH